MKKKLLFLFLISQLGFSQTKIETIDWLNINLEAYGDNQVMGTYQIEIRNSSEYGEVLLFTKKSWNPLLKKSTYDFYSVLPKDVSNVLLSGKSRTNNTLDIFVVSKSENIYVLDDKEHISEIGIHMKNGNNEMTERIHKGLLHLLAIMGNEIKPQEELFKD